MLSSRSQTWFFVILLAVIVFLSWLILAPYVGVLVLAGTLAFLFQPWYKGLLKLFRYKALAASLTVFAVALIVFLPLAFFGLRIFQEATTLYASFAANDGFNLSASAAHFLHMHFPNIMTTQIAALDVNAYIQQAFTWLIQHLGSLFSDIAQLLFSAFLVLLGLFYFITDGDRLKAWLVKTIPFKAAYTEDIVKEMEGVATSVVKGTILVAIVQGIMLGIGMFLFRIPDATFWGALTIPVSVIPILGTWLVAVPAIAYLLLTGQTLLGIGFAAWSIIFINLIYNLLTPQFMHRGVNLPPYLILLSILGGIGFFGPMGFLIGPLVIALLFTLLNMQKKIM